MLLEVIHVFLALLHCAFATDSSGLAGRDCACVIVVCPRQEPRKGLEEDVDVYLHAFDANAIRLSDVEFALSWQSTRSDATCKRRAIIHLENVYQPFRRRDDTSGTKHYMMFNPEIPIADANVFYHVDFVIAKTRIAETVATQVMTAIRKRDESNPRRRARVLPTVLYWGHTSLDRKLPTIHRNASTTREKGFLFVAGASVMKHADAAAEAWKRNADFPLLTLTRFGPFLNSLLVSLQPAMPHNVRVLSTFQHEAAIWRLMNDHLVHICSAYTEGFGHTLNGARSTGAVIIAPDIPPFNEMLDDTSAVLMRDSAIPVHLPVYWYEKRNITGISLLSANVKSHHLASAVRRVLKLTLDEMREMGARARRRYLDARSLFKIVTRSWLVETCRCMNETLVPFC
jgi:hypothetical protein